VSDFRRNVANSRFAPNASLPTRLATVASHDVSVLRKSGRWLVRSREHTNFTYHLSARNLEHLAWWIATVAATDVAEVRGYIAELDADQELRRHIEQATLESARRGLADRDVRYGRRVGWYALTRALRPQHVVETGTDKGSGSCVFAAALLRNETGRLTTIDVKPDSGYLISGPYAEVIDRLVDDSVNALRNDRAPVDLFLHDSWHTFEHEIAELGAVAPRLTDRALVLTDNAHASDALLRWSESTGRRFLFFAEQPADHWYPGSGIGAAWRSS
jgi:predicted O-methyltransferase YrrM